MNKTILGFALIASLHAKSVSGMVSAAVVTPPFASKTTQALYDDYRWFQILNERDSAVESLAANRIRALLTANSLPTNLNDYNETKLALRQIQRCPAANRTELLQLLVLARILNYSALNNILYEALCLGGTPVYNPIINNLVEAGANASLRNAQGNSLLHIAVAAGSRRESTPSSVLILLQHGADANERDGEGYTPLHRAILNNQIEKAIELVEGNADINLTTPEGDTALHLAGNHIQIPMTQILIMSILARANAVIEKTNHQGLTPLDIIRKSYTWETKEEVEHIDFSPILSLFAPNASAYQSRVKFARVVRQLEDIDKARLEIKRKEQAAVMQNRLKAFAAICIVGIIGKLIHSKLVSVKDERAQLAMKTIQGILETKSSTTRDLEAFYTTLTQTPEVGTLTSNLRRLFEESELKELSEEMQLIANHQQKKLYKELNTAYQEHTAFFEVWQKISKVLSHSAQREKQPDIETSDDFVSEVCTTVSTISEVIKTITQEK